MMEKIKEKWLNVKIDEEEYSISESGINLINSYIRAINKANTDEGKDRVEKDITKAEISLLQHGNYGAPIPLSKVLMALGKKF
ncbi:hypothetical protein COT68_00020 [bacterium (Candidatus Torokbacteria) CG09_land_8_20_14_0_10_42_11]|nr:MAG: hypothetical protein COT68_00020 [bacterium (Candidatus Torokbacteria) CG09_land_8_20_14_0_10_42_11]